jgi:serine/threonine protein kinase
MSRGGEVIDSGGYGCIFSPQLQCPNAKKTSGKISKVMLTSNAQDEKNRIDEIFGLLKDIPNLDNYFILQNIDLCQPSKFTQKDLKHFDSTCRALTKKNYTRKNINRHITKVKLLNIPHGGDDLDKVLTNGHASTSLVSTINHLLLQLLLNAILPMNQRLVFHADIKASNIVFNEKTNKIRIIDWGLSAIIKKLPVYKIPQRFNRSSLQYNMPIGLVLLSTSFSTKFATFLAENVNQTSHQMKTMLLDFVVDYIYYCVGEKAGHLEDLKIICGQIYNLDKYEKNKTHTSNPFFIKFNSIINFLAEHLVHIIRSFVTIDRKGNVSMLKYFNSKFIKDVDVWGFLTIYTSFFYVNQNDPRAFENNQIFFDQIKLLLKTHLFTHSVEPIDVTKVVKDLRRFLPPPSKK